MNRKGQEREGWKEKKKMEVKIEKEVEGSRRGEGMGKREKQRKALPLCFRIFHFCTRSFSTSQAALGTWQGTLHLVSSLLVYLQKVVCEWLPLLDWCLAGQHLLLRVWSHRASVVSPRKPYFMTQGTEHWRMCVAKARALLAVHQELWWEVLSPY